MKLAYRMLGTETRRQWRWAVVSMLASVGSALFEGLTFAILTLAIDILTEGSLKSPGPLSAPLRSVIDPLLATLTTGGQFVVLILTTVLLQAIRSALTFVGQVSGAILGSRVQAAVQRSVYARLLHLSFPCVSAYKAGDLSDYVTSPAPAISELVVSVTLLFVNVVTVAVYCVVLLAISPTLFLVAGVSFGLLAFVQKRMSSRVGAMAQSLSHVGARLSQRVVETVQALRIVHAFGRQSTMLREADGELNQILATVRHINLWLAITGPLGELVSMTTVAGFLIFSYYQFGGNRSAISSILIYVAVLNRMSGRVQFVILCFNELMKRFGVVSRLDDFLRDDGKQFLREGGADFTGLRGAVAFESVALTYPGRDEPAVRELSFHLPRGQMTALVGGSGAGKSTVADLLLQLYEPTAGRILADGQPLTELSLDSWRARIGVVSQDTFLFNASVRENIRFGRPDATDADVEAAAAAARADDFVQALPEGYDTLLGERGTRLSGGQRQRIALARMILRQPEIVVLDEATSALDGETERKVQAALEEFLKDRTVLVIAHRLSTVTLADQIVVMEHGRVVEVGTHTTLLTGSSRYADYWRLHTRSEG